MKNSRQTRGSCRFEFEFLPEAFALMRAAMEVPHRLTAAAKAGKALKRANKARAAGKAPWIGYNPNSLLRVNPNPLRWVNSKPKQGFM